MTNNISYRRYDLDWLRVLAILIVFLYHSTRFFNLGDWHVKNIDTYVWVEIWNVFATRWMMPLFFIISGASLFYAIGKFRGWSRFYVNKFLRLMIPVLLASFTFGVLQIYLERVTHGQFSGPFFSFLPEYFNGVYMGIGMTGNFAFHGMHLWYLLFLFIYSLLCYPLFIWFKGSGQKILIRFTDLCANPILLYFLFPFPLFILKAILPPAVLEPGNGGWGFIYYIWFLIAGFIIVSSDRVQQRIMNQRLISLLIAIGLSVIYLYQLFSPTRLILPVGINDWTLALLSFLSAWVWLFTILGFSMRFLAFDRPVLGYANEGVLPFFILHQTVLLSLGYFIMSLEINDLMKWFLVFSTSFIIIVLLYAFVVRKFELLRFLFGMKTSGPFFHIFRKRKVLMIPHGFYIGLIVFAAVGAGRDLSPMPVMYDPEQDVVLNAESITGSSSTGVRVVQDEAASIGRAIEFFSGENQQAEAQPAVYIDMEFSAPAGKYIVWSRGKSDMDNGYTDSAWLQVDEQIGSSGKSIRLGNWLDVHPPGVYGWAGDTDDPISIVLKHDGDHRIRIQPRQTPHRIDQIWLSRNQTRIPNTLKPIK
jgi:glucan biosynthesis protein C